MYTAEQTKVLQEQSKEILSRLNHSVPYNDLILLKQVLRFHEYRYYVLNDPLLADYEYDILYQCLAKQEAAHPELITPDSPTQRVGSSLNPFFETTPHLVPMLSLDNSYNADDLKDFDRKARELSGESNLEYCIEPKFDGASISLFYENDLLVRAVTRGDGVINQFLIGL